MPAGANLFLGTEIHLWFDEPAPFLDNGLSPGERARQNGQCSSRKRAVSLVQFILDLLSLLRAAGAQGRAGNGEGGGQTNDWV